MSARRSAYKASPVSLGTRNVLYGNPHFYRGARGPAYRHLVFFPVLRYPPIAHREKLAGAKGSTDMATIIINTRLFRPKPCMSHYDGIIKNYSV